MARKATGGCSVNGCPRTHWAKGYCSPHYQRWRKTGNPGGPKIGTAKGERMVWLRAHAGFLGNECLLWPFSFNPDGYGAAKWGKRTSITAHRAMCRLAHGEPPSSDHHAAHSCGNRACVNPRHIRWATVSENQMDKHSHGRMPVGEAVHSAKLTTRKVRAMKHMRRSGLSYQVIAERFGVARSTATRAIVGDYWRHA